MFKISNYSIMYMKQSRNNPSSRMSEEEEEEEEEEETYTLHI